MQMWDDHAEFHTAQTVPQTQDHTGVLGLGLTLTLSLGWQCYPMHMMKYCLSFIIISVMLCA